MMNAYMRQDYELEGMYRVETYAECHGYWSTGELLTKEEAEVIVKTYRETI